MPIAVQSLTLEVMVALQGTLDSFALTDVLQLVGSGGKVGALEVVIGGHRSALFLEDGTVTTSMIDDAPCDPHETMCWLLRQTTGTFAFHSDARTEQPTSSIQIAVLVEEATQRNAEMDALLAIVGSLDSWVALNPNVASESISMDRSRWSHLVTIAGGCTVSQYGALLDTGDIGALRVVAELMDTGLVTVAESAHFQAVEFEEDPSPGRRWTDQEPVAVNPGEVQWAPAAEPVATDFVTAAGPTNGYQGPAATAPAPSLPGFAAPVEPVAPLSTWAGSEQPTPPSSPAPGGEWPAAGGEWVDAPSNGHGSPVPASVAAMPQSGSAFVAVVPQNGSVPAPAPSGAPAGAEETDLAAFAQEMANLSPQAARAMARAARASTVEEREQALAELEEENGHLNRGLILRFLGAIEP